LECILWVLRSGARWQDLTEEFPTPSTCWRRGIVLIAPHRSNRCRTPPQDGRVLRRYRNRWIIERSIAWLSNFRRLIARYDLSLGVGSTKIPQEDEDFNHGVLYVRRSVPGSEIGPTKTPGGERRFPLSSPIGRLIRGYLAGRKVQAEWFFPTRKGNRHNDRTLFRRYVQPTIERLRLPHFSWHSTRHTFLTYNGVEGVGMPLLPSLKELGSRDAP
jgi:transposase